MVVARCFAPDGKLPAEDDVLMWGHSEVKIFLGAAEKLAGQIRNYSGAVDVSIKDLLSSAAFQGSADCEGYLRDRQHIYDDVYPQSGLEELEKQEEAYVAIVKGASLSVQPARDGVMVKYWCRSWEDSEPPARDVEAFDAARWDGTLELLAKEVVERCLARR
jgi:NAD-dependent SIR2 family protein deacetylase